MVIFGLGLQVGSAMNTGRGAMILLQRQIAAGGPSHFVGPFFSGANAAVGYLPLQLALRAEGRKGEDSSGKGRFFHTAFGLCLNDRGAVRKVPFKRLYPCQSTAEGRLYFEILTFRTSLSFRAEHEARN